MTSKERNNDSTETGEGRLTTGLRLKQLREKQGHSIEDVVMVTRISAANIRALEAEEYDRLPADTFTRGFIQLYGEFLGADGNALATAFFEERGGAKNLRRNRKDLSNNSLTPKKMAEPAHISSASVATLLLVAIIISFTAFCLYHSWNPFDFLVKPTHDIQSAMVSAFRNGSGDEPPVAETGDQKPTTYLLTARFTKATRVQVTLDDLETSSGAYKAGDLASWTALKHLTIVFDQPEAAELTINGKPLPFPTSQGGTATIQLPQAQP